MSTFSVSTKPSAEAPAVQTSLTINWDGITTEQLQAIATTAIVVKWQASARKNGIPETADIKAVDYVPGKRIAQPKLSLEELLGKLSPEERAKLLEKYL